MTNVEKLKEQQIRLAASFKNVTLRLRKAQIEDRKQRYENAGKDLEQLYLSDPTCSNSKKIVSLCAQYFGSSSDLNNDKIQSIKRPSDDSSKINAVVTTVSEA
jgi:hypothetical protein